MADWYKRIQEINKEMNLISNLARAYANATDEQRANVDRDAMQGQLDRYNKLKEERAILYAEQEARVQQELAAQKQAAEQAAKQIINTRGTGRRYWGWNGWDNGWGNGWLSDEQYAEWLNELEKEAYLSQPHPIFNNWDGTYYYSDGTTRYEDWNIVWGQSTNIEVRTSPSWAPYFYDKTTGNQVAPIGTDEFGNPLVVDSQWGVATMYPIDNAIKNTIIANQMASDAARAEDAAIGYANDVRDDTVVNLALAPTYLAWGVWVNGIRNAWVGSNALWRAYTTANNALRYNRAIERANAIWNLWRQNVVPASRAITSVSEWRIINPTYWNQYSNWAQKFMNTANKLANEHTANYYANQTARKIASNYNPTLSNWNNIVNTFNANKSIFPQGGVSNNGVNYVNSLLNSIKPFSL